MLAFTFGTYGVLKKQLDLGPLLSVTAEVLVLVPIALVYAIAAGPGDLSTGTHLLLIASGPLTATPLILFSYAARRVRLATIGLLQYLNPTLQFLCATLVFREAFTRWHLIAFALIWTALAVYSGAAFRRPAPDPAPPPSPPHPAPR